MKINRVLKIVIVLFLLMLLNPSSAALSEALESIYGKPLPPFQPNFQNGVIIDDGVEYLYKIHVNQNDKDLVGLVFSLPDEVFETLQVNVIRLEERFVFESFNFEGDVIRSLEDIPGEWISIFNRSLYSVKGTTPKGIAINEENNSYWIISDFDRINVPFYSVLEFHTNQTTDFYVVLFPNEIVFANSTHQEFMPNVTVNSETLQMYETGYTWFTSLPLYYLDGVLYRQYYFE